MATTPRRGKTGPHRIVAHVVPFLFVRLGGAQNMVEKSLLPKWRIEVLISEPCWKWSLECLHPAREIDSFFVKSDENVNAIWHDDITAGKCSECFPWLRKLNRGACAKRLSRIRRLRQTPATILPALTSPRVVLFWT